LMIRTLLRALRVGVWGRRRGGMNPFAGPAQSLSAPPLKMTARMQLFGEAAKRLSSIHRSRCGYPEPYRPPALMTRAFLSAPPAFTVATAITTAAM
jgi:hypothetical protein